VVLLFHIQDDPGSNLDS